MSIISKIIGWSETKRQNKSHHTFYVIDDNKDAAEVIKTIVLDNYPDVFVRTFNDSQLAYDSLIDQEVRLPELILSDQIMPGMNGLNLQKKLIDNHIKIPFIFLTGLNGDDVEEEVLVVLAKPFNTQKLVHHIERLTGIRPQSL